MRARLDFRQEPMRPIGDAAWPNDGSLARSARMLHTVGPGRSARSGSSDVSAVRYAAHPVYGTTSSASAATCAELTERRRARDKAAAEARAAFRAAAATRTAHAAPKKHYSDSYTAGWERRLSAFDSELPSVRPTLRAPAKKEFPLALKGWRQQEGLPVSAIPFWNEPGLGLKSPGPCMQGGPDRPVDIWKDVDVAEVCWTELLDEAEETEDTH